MADQIEKKLRTDIRPFVNKIHHGDCVEILKKLPDNSIDVIFADPPYFMQTEGQLLRSNGTKFAGVDDSWDKFKDYKVYDAFSEAWLKECRRILTPNGAIWVIGSFQNIYRMGYIMQNLGFWILNDVVWSKPNAVPNFGGTRFQNSHETLLWCSKDKAAKYTFNYKTMKHLNGDKQDKSVWNIGICIGQERLKDKHGVKVHATQKPEKLLYKVIASSSRPGDIVLDPFFGTGTTGAVAKRLGRNYIGIDNSAEYIKIAKERIRLVSTEDTDISQLALEVKPPRVTMQQLLAAGMIKTGQALYDKSGKRISQVSSNGHVYDGQDVLSIHKMSAKYLKKTNHNGWNYFYAKKGGKLKPIDTYRYEYKEVA